MQPFERRQRLLLVDDDPVIRALAARDLKTVFPDIEIDEIDSEAALCQSMAQGGYDLVITDYQLPWTDGVTIVREAEVSLAWLPGDHVYRLGQRGDRRRSDEGRPG